MYPKGCSHLLILPGWEIKTCSGKEQDLFQKSQLNDDNHCNYFSFWPSGYKLIPALIQALLCWCFLCRSQMVNTEEYIHLKCSLRRLNLILIHIYTSEIIRSDPVYSCVKSTHQPHALNYSPLKKHPYVAWTFKKSTDGLVFSHLKQLYRNQNFYLLVKTPYRRRKKCWEKV